LAIEFRIGSGCGSTIPHDNRTQPLFDSPLKETTMLRPFRRFLRHAGALLLAVLALAPAHAAEQNTGGPLSLIVTYHASPASRVALRQELEGAGVRQFQHWQDAGVLSNFNLLFGRYADGASPDAVALLAFPDYAALERWKTIERSFPGGLGARALALTASIQTAPADLVRSKRKEASSASSVFVVIPYETMISAPEYLKYADGYVLPQFDGWMKEGVLARYGIYIDRYPAGRPWATMVILEYRNDAALGAREAVVAKVRAGLKDYPEWKAISDAKQNIRKEMQLLIADPLGAR
jgi:hypothetical protein